jgi:two-component system, NtrC family, response regulator HydG
MPLGAFDGDSAECTVSTLAPRDRHASRGRNGQGGGRFGRVPGARSSVLEMPKHDAPTDSEDVSTFLQPRFLERPVATVAFDLEVIEGPESGQRFTVDPASPSRVLAGQSPACAVHLSDRAVSRRHLAFELGERGLRLTDLGSTNGTFVNAMPVVEMFLQGGEIIRVGATTLRVSARPAVQGPEPPRATSFGRLVGASLEMRRLYPLCERLAQSNVPVIIEGETGTGKEVLAESLHERGPRAAGPFVVFDCTAIAPNLVESELFGHERGSFTGATATRKGVFEQAQGGTLLIDEIGDLAPELQAKLLRAIERSELRRVGGDRTIRVDVRILAATRRDLDREVALGRFRDDLFHRLAVARIELPPLRRRRGDVGILVQYFSAQLGADEPVQASRILLHLRRWEDDPWPGNVRELRNAVARQLALGDLADLDASSADEERGDSFERILSRKLSFGRARALVLEEFRSR